jgi:hypothetical protein
MYKCRAISLFESAIYFVFPFGARTCCSSGHVAIGIEIFSLFHFYLGGGLYQVVAQLALTLKVGHNLM